MVGDIKGLSYPLDQLSYGYGYQSQILNGGNCISGHYDNGDNTCTAYLSNLIKSGNINNSAPYYSTSSEISAYEYHVGLANNITNAFVEFNISEFQSYEDEINILAITLNTNGLTTKNINADLRNYSSGSLYSLIENASTSNGVYFRREGNVPSILFDETVDTQFLNSINGGWFSFGFKNTSPSSIILVNPVLEVVYSREIDTSIYNVRFTDKESNLKLNRLDSETYEMNLLSQPTDDVRIDITSSRRSGTGNLDKSVFDNTKASTVNILISPEFIIFTPDNWNIRQSIKFKTYSDTAQGLYSINHRISSNDINFAEAEIEDYDFEVDFGRGSSSSNNYETYERPTSQVIPTTPKSIPTTPISSPTKGVSPSISVSRIPTRVNVSPIQPTLEEIGTVSETEPTSTVFEASPTPVEEVNKPKKNLLGNNFHVVLPTVIIYGVASTFSIYVLENILVKKF